MGAGKTFTNAIIREIGRNYGKAISNKLMGSNHSTPIRVAGGGNVTQKGRGKYESKLDEHLQKFAIKGKLATFNQAQNIHLEFFNFVDEINADGRVDIDEFKELCNYIPRVIKTLDNIISALKEMDESKVENVEDKKRDIIDFRDTLVESFQKAIDNGIAKTSDKSTRNRGILLSLISLDRVFFYPKQWKSYMPLAFLGVLIYSLNSQGVDGAEEVTLIHYISMMLVNALFYAVIWNPISRGGVWKYLKINKNSNKTYKQLEIMVDELKAV